jgi:hypothetical protein
MPLQRRATNQFRNFNIGVNYKVYDTGNTMRDAKNVCTIQDRLVTRYGYSRFNAVAFDEAITSMSFFKNSDTVYRLTKSGTTLYDAKATGAHTSVKTGLTAGIKHRALTFNGRHIVACGNDGLFSWNGTTFTQLGQSAPTTLTAAIASGGSLTTGDNYQAAITFYASTVGFESNAQLSGIVSASGTDLRVALSDIPATASNDLVDRVRIYLKNVSDNSNFLFIDEINLGTTTYNIDNESTSTQTPPTTNAAPLSGGGKYLTTFNERLVVAGNNNFKNDVFFSEPNLPDAFDDTDTARTLNIPEDGDITGLATGLFNDSQLDPYLVIFKKNSTHVYSEIGGSLKFVTIDNRVGCVSHDTIIVRRGSVYFLSDRGWRVIFNGSIYKAEKSNNATLSNGDIDDIFTSKGFVYEVNRSQLVNAFSAYYPTLEQYITWIAEGSNNSFSKQYCYELELDKFKPYEFTISATCATASEDVSGNPCVMFGDSGGYIYKHSIEENKVDVNPANESAAIDAFAQFSWNPTEGDFDASYNFREFIIRAITGGDITVKAWRDFNLSENKEYTYSFPDPISGFILDESFLDVDVFSDGRAIVQARNDINMTGKVLLLSVYQNSLTESMELLSAQVDFSKNGNPN